MRKASCASKCLFTSLRQVIGEHLFIILAAGLFGGLIGLGFGSISGILAGAGGGLLLATVYGYIPRMTDCVEACPLQ